MNNITNYIKPEQSYETGFLTLNENTSGFFIGFTDEKEI